MNLIILFWSLHITIFFCLVTYAQDPGQDMSSQIDLQHKVEDRATVNKQVVRTRTILFFKVPKLTIFEVRKVIINTLPELI